MTSRVPPIWLLALLLVAICIIYVLSPSDPAQAENLQAEASSVVEKTQAESHVAIDHSATAEGSSAPRAPSKEASREQVGSTLRTFGLQTLDPIRWRAAKNSKIFYTTDALLRAEPEKYQDFHPGNPWAHEDLSFLPSVTTDEHGNAVFRVPGDVGYFYCSYENTRGMLKLTMKGLNSPEVSNDRVIRLHQADVVEVQVSRANGKPAIGVPLKFYRSGTEWVESGADGKAFLLSPPVDAKEVFKGTGVSELPLLFLKRDRFSLSDSHAPIGYQIPPCGSVVLQTMPGSDLTYYLRANPGNKRWVEMEPDFRSGHGQVRYDFVPLSTSVEICAAVEPPGQADFPILYSQPGPKKDGDVIQLNWASSPVCMIRGRLFDEHGKPWGNHRFTLYPFNSMGGLLAKGLPMRTNNSGRFELPLHPSKISLPEVSTFWIRTQSKHVRLKDFVVDGLQLKRGSVTSLGNLSPAPLTVLTKGKVINSFGEAVPSLAGSYSFKTDYIGRGGIGQRFNVGNLVMEGKEKNEFIISSPEFPFPSNWYLSLQGGANHNPARQTVAAGTSGNVITVAEFFKVEASLYPPLDGGLVTLKLVPEEGVTLAGQYTSYQRRRSRIDFTGPVDCTFSRAEEGEFTLRALNSRDEVLLEIPQIRLTKGNPRPPQLQNLDFRGDGMNVAYLTVDGAIPEEDGGRLVGRAALFKGEVDRFREVRGLSIDGSRVLFLPSISEGEHLFAVQGFYPVDMSSVGNGSTINLRSLPTVDVKIPELEKLAEEVYCSVEIDVAPFTRDCAVRDFVLDDHSIAQGHLRVTGMPGSPCRARFRIWRLDRGSRVKRFSYGVPFNLGDMGSQSTIEIGVPPDFWQGVESHSQEK